MNFSDYDYDNRHYNDPLFPPDLFSSSQVVFLQLDVDFIKGFKSNFNHSLSIRRDTGHGSSMPLDHWSLLLLRSLSTTGQMLC